MGINQISEINLFEKHTLSLWFYEKGFTHSTYVKIYNGTMAISALSTTYKCTVGKYQYRSDHYCIYNNRHD